MTIQPAQQAITNFLFIESSIKPVDLIFVTGTHYLPTMDEVAKLYKKGISSNIFIAGKGTQFLPKSEGEVFKQKGIELGIPEECISIETNSTNTKENFEFSVPLIDFKNIKSILFVCKSFHARRVLMTARKFFPHNINYSFYPIVDERNIRKDNWWNNDIARKRVLSELGRIPAYVEKGDISIN